MERDFVQVDPFDRGDFDAIIVLGGATRRGINGRPQPTSSGDRVVLAAQLYHAKKCSLLVVTGESRHGGRKQDPAIQAASIWEHLGIPSKSIIRIGGSSTHEEMQEIRTLFRSRDWDRVGLVTSAWHMNRAVEHAKSNGLLLEPLPADY